MYLSGTKNYEDYCEGLIKNLDSGLAVAEEIPDEAQLKKLYEQDYFFGQEYSDYINDRPALEKNFKKRIKFLKSKGFINSKKSLAEVGCAYGYFLDLVKGETKSHIGFDVTADGVKFAKEELGVNATVDNFLTHKFDNKVDIVCMWDVIEHVSRPEEFIDKASKVLKKGGALSLTTGDIGTFVPRYRKGSWRMIHPPTHIYYFDKKSMVELLEKYGFEVQYYKYEAVYRNLGSVMNQLIINRKAIGKNPILFEVSLKIFNATHLNRLNIPLNLRDIMFVTAVRKG